jgi:hypothetical protein
VVWLTLFERQRLRESCVVTSSMFRLDTGDLAVYEYALPVDDTIDASTYVGDWEELYISTYLRVFGGREHVLYWGKSEIGVFVTCVGRAVEDMGHPTLSLGPNGFHFSRLPSTEGHDFPSLKALPKLFPHLEECKYAYARDAEKLSTDLLSFEQKMKPTRYKFGVLYMQDNQTEENDIYGNLDPSTGFVDFLKILGNIIELRSHKGYKGGLDCSGADSTGELSVYTNVSLADGRYVALGAKPPLDALEMVSLDIMFHVAPFLPYSSLKEEGNQQLQKKRHLGNDICVVIYKEGTSKLNPDVFKSQFNHVYVLVTPCAAPGSAVPVYKVEVVTKGLKGFLPRVPHNGVLSGEALRDWLLLKLINGEVAAMNAKDLRLKMKRTRTQTLESWAKSHMGEGTLQSATVKKGK